MFFKSFGNRFLLRFSKGEDFALELKKFCLQNSIETAVFQGLGAFLSCELDFYDLRKKEYLKTQIVETSEVLSLTGNVTTVENEPFFHAHVVLSDVNFNSKGGHLFNAKIGVTLEVILEKLAGKLNRQLDNETGLKLLVLD